MLLGWYVFMWLCRSVVLVCGCLVVVVLFCGCYGGVMLLVCCDVVVLLI